MSELLATVSSNYLLAGSLLIVIGLLIVLFTSYNIVTSDSYLNLRASIRRAFYWKSWLIWIGIAATVIGIILIVYRLTKDEKTS